MVFRITNSFSFGGQYIEVSIQTTKNVAISSHIKEFPAYEFKPERFSYQDMEKNTTLQINTNIRNNTQNPLNSAL